MIKNFFTKNISEKILSVLLSIALYFYVLQEVNPLVVRDYKIDIKVENIPKDIYLISEIPKCTVTLKGRRRVIDLLSSSHIKSFIDLKSLIKGKYDVPVHLMAPEDVELVSINPKKIKVELDTTEEKEFFIRIHKSGEPEMNYIIESIKIKPEKARISGFSRDLKRVKYLIVNVDQKGITSEVKKELPLYALDKDAVEINTVKIKPDKIWVWIKAVALITSEVPVFANLVGEPPRGYKIKEVLIEPSKVRVSIPQSKTLFNIKTAPINLKEKTSDLNLEVSLNVPSFVNAVDYEMVKVKVKIEKEE